MGRGLATALAGRGSRPLLATGALFEEALVGFTAEYVAPVLPRLRRLLDAELDRP